jgi:hypothetical protein
MSSEKSVLDTLTSECVCQVAREHFQKLREEFWKYDSSFDMCVPGAGADAIYLDLKELKIDCHCCKNVGRVLTSDGNILMRTLTAGTLMKVEHAVKTQAEDECGV